MEEKKINKRIAFSVVAVLLLIAVVAGATYAYFSAGASSAAQTVTTGTVDIGFALGDTISLPTLIPISDSEIKTKAAALPFSITNNGSEHMKVEIKLTDIVISDDLKDIDFRWGLYNADDIGLSFGFFKNIGDSTEVTIYEDFVIDAGEPTRNYKVRVWIHDDGAEQNYMQGESFSAKVAVNGKAVEYTPETCFTFDNGTITDYDVSCGGTDVVIPKTINGETVTTIDGHGSMPEVGAFGSKGLTSIIIPVTVTSLNYTDTGIFGGNNIKNITIPESLTSSTDTYTFSANYNLSTIRAHENANIFMKAVFSNSDNVNEIVIPGGAKQIGTIALFETDIVLMDGIETIGYGAFRGIECSEIEIPSSVKIIENNAFPGSTDPLYQTNLTKIVVRGKTSLSDFTNSSGLTQNGGLHYGVKIEFRP